MYLPFNRQVGDKCNVLPFRLCKVNTAIGLTTFEHCIVVITYKVFLFFRLPSIWNELPVQRTCMLHWRDAIKTELEFYIILLSTYL